MSGTNLSTLPVEVLEAIYRVLDPASHLNLALTNKHIYAQSERLIKHHQKWASNYFCNPYCDWSAETLTRTLRTIAADHVAAWHVTWIKGLYPDDEYEQKPLEGVQLRQLVDFVEAKMKVNDIPVFALEEMREGKLEALQVAFIALCPQIYTLGANEQGSFRPYGDGRDGRARAQNLWAGSQVDQHYIGTTGHSLFSNYIKAILEGNPQLAWPPGLDFMRTVSIGESGVQQEFINAINVVPVFMLPNIKNIYLGGLFVTDDDISGLHPDRTHVIPAKCSSVQNLFIENMSHDRVKYAIMDFIECAKTLRSFIIKNGESHDFDFFPSTLLEHHRQNLKTFIYTDEEGELRGYRCTKFQPETVGTLNCNWWTHTVDFEDVRLDSLYLEQFHPEGTKIGMTGNSGNRESFFDAFAHAIPHRAGRMLFRNSEHLIKADVEVVIDALHHLFQKTDEGRVYLDTIYFDEVVAGAREFKEKQHGCPSTKGTPCGHTENVGACADVEDWCERLVKCGQEYGTEIIIEPGATLKYIEQVCDEWPFNVDFDPREEEARGTDTADAEEEDQEGKEREAADREKDDYGSDDEEHLVHKSGHS